jgi:hypothetical protein
VNFLALEILSDVDVKPENKLISALALLGMVGIQRQRPAKHSGSIV